MSEDRKTSWFKNAMLLASLAAGVFATQLMPTYDGPAGKVTYPSRAAANRTVVEEEPSRGYSHVERSPKLTLVRNAK
jgi:hypothetical protein